MRQRLDDRYGSKNEGTVNGIARYGTSLQILCRHKNICQWPGDTHRDVY